MQIRTKKTQRSARCHDADSALSAPHSCHHHTCPPSSAGALTHSIDRHPPPRQFRQRRLPPHRPSQADVFHQSRSIPHYKISIPEEYRVHVNYTSPERREDAAIVMLGASFPSSMSHLCSHDCSAQWGPQWCSEQYEASRGLLQQKVLIYSHMSSSTTFRSLTTSKNECRLLVASPLSIPIPTCLARRVTTLTNADI